MKYSFFDEVVDVDDLLLKINGYVQKIRELDNNFKHHKNVENFERIVEKEQPKNSYKICSIYGHGRDLIISTFSIIEESLDVQRCPSLKSIISVLEPNLEQIRAKVEETHTSVNEKCEELNYTQYSVSLMISDLVELSLDIDNILNIVRILKATDTYRYEIGELTIQDIQEKGKQHVIHNEFSGIFNQSIISQGDNNLNEINSTENTLEKICYQMIGIISNSNESQDSKESLNLIVKEIEQAKDKSGIRDGYNKLIRAISHHFTVFSVFAKNGLLESLSKCF